MFVPGAKANLTDLSGNWVGRDQRFIAGIGLLSLPVTEGVGSELKTLSNYYSVAFETELGGSLYSKGYYTHFKVANEALSEAIKADEFFASSMKDLGIEIPRSSTGSIIGRSPTNWVWHHNIESGVMQLVPKAQHSVGSIFWKVMHPNGYGGMSIWGSK